MNEKICSNCEESKSVSEFHKNKAQKDGYNFWCKVCRSKHLAEKKKNEIRILSDRLCECGCGEFTFIAKSDSSGLGGVKRGQPCRYLPKHFGGPEKMERESPQFKICPNCGESKQAIEFNKGKDRVDGLSYLCKECNNDYLKSWVNNNPEKKKIGKIRDYEKNSSRYKIKASKWKKDNRLQASLNNINGRARLRGIKGTFDIIQLKSKLEYYDFKCWICGNKYEAMDHVKPLNLDGQNLVANIRPICKSCNGIKGDRWYGVKNFERISEEVKGFKQRAKRKIHKRS